MSYDESGKIDVFPNGIAFCVRVPSIRRIIRKKKKNGNSTEQTASSGNDDDVGWQMERGKIPFPFARTDVCLSQVARQIHVPSIEAIF